jgi:histone H3/H4
VLWGSPQGVREYRTSRMSTSGTTPGGAAAAAAASAPAAVAATSKATAPTAATSTAGAAAATSTTKTTATASKKKKAATPKAAAAAAAATTTATKKKPARKRKPPVSKASASASNQAVWNDARAAASDLAQQRALGAARRADPLWYRMEDVVPVHHHHHHQNSSRATPLSSPLNAFLSEQMQVVERALAKNGLTRSDLTPQALACLSEHARRYTQELLRDAQDFCDTVGRPEITRADLLLASELRHDHPVAISTQLPQLNLVARHVNRKPLPPIPSHCYSGIVLPPKQNQLTARTFDIVSGALTAQKMVQALPQPPGSFNANAAAASSTNTADTTGAAAGGGSATTAASNKRKSSGGGGSSYGASRGRQIPVKLKETTPSTGSSGAS